MIHLLLLKLVRHGFNRQHQNTLTCRGSDLKTLFACILGIVEVEVIVECCLMCNKLLILL